MASQKVRQLAEHLVCQEALLYESEYGGGFPEFTVYEKLRTPISSLAGKAGFQALLSRALKMSEAQSPQLNSLRVKDDGRLEGFAEMRPRLSALEIADVEVVVVTHVLELLCTFLGETLTIRLVQDLWPGASLNGVDSTKETTL